MLITVMFACGDDDSGLPADYLAFGSKTMKINRPFFAYSNEEHTARTGIQDEVYYRHSLAIYSIDFPEMGNDHLLNGTGDYLSMRVTTTDQSLQNGTYTFDGGLVGAGKFEANLYMNFDSSAPGNADLYTVFEGTLTVSSSGNNFEIDFNGAVEDNGKNKKVKARYAGTIKTAPL
jgi:hypothetical protein